MIGVLVVSHGKLAEGMLDTVQMVLGEERGIDAASLAAGEDYAVFERELEVKMRALDDGDGVIVLADLFGASPFNVAQQVARTLGRQGLRSRVVAGVNLGMVVEIMVLRGSEGLDDLAATAVACGRRGIGCPAASGAVEDEDDY